MKGDRSLRQHARVGLLWLPLVGALWMVALTPEAPIDGGLDAPVYIEQAGDILEGKVPSGRYPPGWAAVLAAGELGGLRPQQVNRLVTIALVAAVVLAARRIGGPVCGAVAGVLCCASPWLIASSRWVASDPLAALLAVGGLLAVAMGRRKQAGVLAVLAVLVRLASFVGVAALLPVGKRLATVCFIVSAVALGAFQWAASGSPISTGYEAGGAQWSLSHVIGSDVVGDGGWIVDGSPAQNSVPLSPRRDWPNVLAYPLVILGATFVFMPPFVASIGLWALWRRRRSAESQYVLLWVGGSLVLYLPYFFQSARFMAPAMMLVLVYTAVGTVDLATPSGSPSARGDEAEYRVPDLP